MLGKGAGNYLLILNSGFSIIIISIRRSANLSALGQNRQNSEGAPTWHLTRNINCLEYLHEQEMARGHPGGLPESAPKPAVEAGKSLFASAPSRVPCSVGSHARGKAFTGRIATPNSARVSAYLAERSLLYHRIIMHMGACKANVSRCGL